MCGIWAYLSPQSVTSDLLYPSFMKISERGPESSTFSKVSDRIFLGFHRLAIHGLSGSGNQPFVKDMDSSTIYCICNGEIYNYDQIISTHSFPLQGKSDCEVLPFLYQKYGEDMIDHLDGEFAFILISVNHTTQTFKIFCGRDPYGVRPLFYGFGPHQELVLCSELKGLVDLCQEVFVFPPSHTLSFSKNMKFTKYQPKIHPQTQNLVDTFSQVVKKRLYSERPLGCLLSGGLDSSIVSAVASKYSDHPLRTFTIGLEGATDIYYAEKVAKHIGSIHTTFLVAIQEALESLEKVIYQIESYDCTTVRASVWQYLLGKKIKENTDIKVLLTGEGSDELMSGYLYFHRAPSAEESHQENLRLLEDIHRFDGLRVDRAMSCHGLEVRIPFLDPEFTTFFLGLSKEERMASRGIEKQLFRDAFCETHLLPNEVLYRKKEAFSDGTSSKEKSWFEILQDHIDLIISDEEFEVERNKFTWNTPNTKEKYYYRKMFVQHFGSKSEKVIPYEWLPKWCGEVKDPSARVLSVYH